jgi:hypothetical protein
MTCGNVATNTHLEITCLSLRYLVNSLKAYMINFSYFDFFMRAARQQSIATSNLVMVGRR